MFKYLFKILGYQDKLKTYRKESTKFTLKSATRLGPSLSDNLKLLKQELGQNPYIIYRYFQIADSTKAALVYVNGLVDKTVLNESILHPLMYDTRLLQNVPAKVPPDIDILGSSLLAICEVEKAGLLAEIIEGCLSGQTALLVNGSRQALLLSTQGWKTRAISEPLTEAVVRGPRESFTETILTNIALLQRKIKNPALTLEKLKVGRQTRTEVCIAYLKGIANPGLIAEIKARLGRIDVDAILESGYIEQYIEDNPYSPFATIANSEKPDVVAAKLLEGRAAILVDGTPFVLTVPMLFIESFQSSEDYYSRPFYTGIIRMLRFVAFAVSVLGPAVYVALTTFQQEFIPTALLLTMAAAREGVPFPAVVEALIMGIAYELLREAGIRLPRPVGQTISIVGALVIGEAAVSAGIIGAPMVIVVSLTAIASFVVPAQTDVQSILRIGLLILAAVMGPFGIAIGLLMILIHLCSLRSFGSPYLAPLAPLIPGDLKDSFVRAPLYSMIKRPRTISKQEPKRQNRDQGPHKPS